MITAMHGTRETGVIKILAKRTGQKQKSGRLELPISEMVLEAVGLSPDPNLDIMSRLWEAAPASSIVVSALRSRAPGNDDTSALGRPNCLQDIGNFGSFDFPQIWVLD